MDHSNRPRDYLTVKDRVAEEVGIARRAWLEGRRVGRIEGREAAWYEAYATGFGDCAEKAGVVITPAGVHRRGGPLND